MLFLLQGGFSKLIFTKLYDIDNGFIQWEVKYQTIDMVIDPDSIDL